MQAKYGENEIKSVLQKVKIFNKNLGAYQLFAITNNFDYAVKLSNGTIIIKIEELQDDERDALTPERLTAIANRFISSTPETKIQPQEVITPQVNTNQTTQQVQQAPKKKKKGLMWGLISVGALTIIVVVAILIKNNSPGSYSPPTTPTTNDVYTEPVVEAEAAPPIQMTEDELKQELYQTEASNPLNYLSVNYTWRVNLVANTILEGHVYNSATMAGFKNVTIKASFYSKTDVLLGEEDFTIMEFVEPGGSAYFRHKITGWWKDVANSKYAILSAETY